MITLEVREFQWINGPADDPSDQCAHGSIHFQVNSTEFVNPSDGIWTISATGLYLLRTLTEDHTAENPVAEGNFLFPCCGFNVWECGTRFKVLCMGCPSGIDPEVTHQSEMIAIRSDKGLETIPLAEWKSAVIRFVESVERFYSSCLPKVEIDDPEDRKGWASFWLEWRERYNSIKSPST